MKDLLSHLLQVDVTKRYGNLKNGVNDIKTHQWFYTTDWIAILQRKVKPPYVPKTKGSGLHFFCRIWSAIDLFFLGDASNFRAYEEEPRKEILKGSSVCIAYDSSTYRNDRTFRKRIWRILKQNMIKHLYNHVVIFSSSDLFLISIL